MPRSNGASFWLSPNLSRPTQQSYLRRQPPEVHVLPSAERVALLLQFGYSFPGAIREVHQLVIAGAFVPMLPQVLNHPFLLVHVYLLVG